MPRLDTARTKYCLHQSPLFGLEGKRKLAQLLGWSGTSKQLDEFAAREDNYRVFKIQQAGKKPRVVQEPKDGLQKLHRRIASLLLRIEPPAYLHSGLRGRSFVTNGQQHTNAFPSIKLDIKSFYPSTTWAHVYRFFLNQMKCSPDVSGLLASIACYTCKEVSHLPTGSSVSQILAFYAHKGMFDEIDAFARARDGVFTVYVDDIMISLPDGSPRDIERVGRLVTRQGLCWGKERFFPAGASKRITGTIIKAGRIEADKQQHFKYSTALEAMDDPTASPRNRATSARRAMGVLQSIAQVDSRYSAKASGMSRRLRKIANTHEMLSTSMTVPRKSDAHCMRA